MMRRQQEEILNYLNTAYCGAKMAGDAECMIKLARRLLLSTSTHILMRRNTSQKSL